MAVSLSCDILLVAFKGETPQVSKKRVSGARASHEEIQAVLATRRMSPQSCYRVNQADPFLIYDFS